MFPCDTEQTPAAYDPRRVLGDPQAVRDILRGLRLRGSTVHVVLGNYAVANGRLAVPHVETLLLDELQRLGFGSVAADTALGVIQYRRPVSLPAMDLRD
jgi:hypothetical protein